MKPLYFISAGVTVFIIIGIIIFTHMHSATPDTLHSPYIHEQERNIKALSEKDIEGLLQGSGTPFGGMAKAAELNGYPGPRHVIDAYKQKDLLLTNEQYTAIESLYEQMRLQSIPLGKEIIQQEKKLQEEFVNHTITPQKLKELVENIGALYGTLRSTHLQYHLSTKELLTPEQVEKYNTLRGYTSGDPCNNIPKGHNAEMWKAHHNC